MDFSEHARMEITQECLPPNFQNEIVENGDIVIIRSNIKSMTEIKEWVNEFGIRTNTKWNSRDSCPSGERYVCRKKFVCRHSAFMKVPPSENKKKNSKNAKCLASVTVKVKMSTSYTREKDKFIKRGLVGFITVAPSHTHKLILTEKSKRYPAKNYKTSGKYINDGIENLSCDKNSSSTSELVLITPRRSSRNCKKKESLSSDENSSCTLEFPLTTPRHSSGNCVQAEICKKKGNLSFNKKSSSTSKLFFTTPRHYVQAYKNHRKKELGGKLMELFGSGLERFEASEQALKMAVEHIKNISTKAQWDVMLETLGQQCFLKENG